MLNEELNYENDQSNNKTINDLCIIVANLEKLLLSQKLMLTIDEALKYTGLSKSYIYKLTSAGEIPYYKPNGKLIYFNKNELDQWLQQNRVAGNFEHQLNALNYSHSKRQ